ncbi:MAG: hypothetical protein U9R55_04735 [Pseudomonadota bacterium]|jgi:hypothetical protein|uniref:hypothetical protein n=1 Tax=Curvibacter delicatus TaxID=80879 RepID=UPI00082E1733|nr:hypothetical protein [Curvibacter delicatus]MEA3393916.1 hypothetical protein [Pseudomonadota bacterium]
MTSFVHVEYPSSHPGVARLENAVAAAGKMRKGFDTTKGLAAMLLAAMVAALVVVADQLVDTWADGHLLAGWVVLWVVGFAAIALLADTARHLAARSIKALDAWSRGVARKRADERLWELARKDERVMADLQAARTRQEA